MADVFKSMNKQQARAAAWKLKTDGDVDAAQKRRKTTVKSQIRSLKRLLNTPALDPRARKDKTRLLRKLEARVRSTPQGAFEAHTKYVAHSAFTTAVC